MRISMRLIRSLQHIEQYNTLESQKICSNISCFIPGMYQYKNLCKKDHSYTRVLFRLFAPFIFGTDGRYIVVNLPNLDLPTSIISVVQRMFVLKTGLISLRMTDYFRSFRTRLCLRPSVHGLTGVTITYIALWIRAQMLRGALP